MNRSSTLKRPADPPGEDTTTDQVPQESHIEDLTTASASSSTTPTSASTPSSSITSFTSTPSQNRVQKKPTPGRQTKSAALKRAAQDRRQTTLPFYTSMPVTIEMASPPDATLHTGITNADDATLYENAAAQPDQPNETDSASSKPGPEQDMPTTTGMREGKTSGSGARSGFRNAKTKERSSALKKLKGQLSAPKRKRSGCNNTHSTKKNDNEEDDDDDNHGDDSTKTTIGQKRKRRARSNDSSYKKRREGSKNGAERGGEEDRVGAA
ncbi:hypothetical protein EDB81DRAFT_877608 [Dactylonectria macrodidyma]|uniref:Uncharacterized protein n=1 Tax=Dactylonectria macrodidyma TaxID=307937 RepID=A0A9P9JEP7_9HYPO|nr:hypothetical protein EDB81DRAFT_877608 [Dactylonectria macrodidyma]